MEGSAEGQGLRAPSPCHLSLDDVPAGGACPRLLLSEPGLMAGIQLSCYIIIVVVIVIIIIAKLASANRAKFDG